jgi:glycosyltransferase involved in cell wall biosynthesis
MNPEITVLLPIYNGSRFLEDTINSILNQSYANYELLIIDDGSDDASREIIDNYKRFDKRIKAIYKEHSGLVDSLNLGLSYARGNWIARADADDLCKIERFAEQLDFVKQNPDVVVLGSGFDLIDKNGKIITKRSFKNETDIIDSILEKSECFPHSSAIISTDILKKVKGYNLNFARAQDWDLWLRCSQFGNIAVHPKRLISLREHDKRMSYDNGIFNQIIYSHCATSAYYLSEKLKQELDHNENFLSYMDFVRQHLVSTNIEYSHVIRSNLIASITHYGVLRSITLKNIMLFIKYKILKMKRRSKIDIIIAQQWIKKN